LGASLNEDANRRDFTVNALYFEANSGNILDFHGGLTYLKRKEIAFIGSPAQRILEDPLRIVRGLRFCLALDFTLEEKTKRAMQKNFSMLKSLTRTMVEKEVLKLKNKKREKILEKVINNPELLDKYFI